MSHDCRIGDAKVVNSRMHCERGYVRRRRECLKCGCRFTTVEITDRDMIELTDVLQLFKKLEPALKQLTLLPRWRRGRPRKA